MFDPNLENKVIVAENERNATNLTTSTQIPVAGGGLEMGFGKKMG